MAWFQVNFFSVSLGRQVGVHVLLPAEMPGPIPATGSEGAGKQKFKTLYLLHGYMGNANDWLINTPINELSQQYGLAVVMPSGDNGFYVDQPTSGVKGATYIGQELVEYTRKIFPLSDKREDTIIGGISMLATPLLTYLGTGPCIIMLFFINGIVGVVHGFFEHRFDKSFFLAVLSLILGIIGLTVPGIAEMNNSILLYMAAGWFILHGVFTIINAIAGRKEGGMKILSIVLGVVAIILGIYSIAHPAVLAVSLGILISFYFIESGIDMILIGSAYSMALAGTGTK